MQELTEEGIVAILEPYLSPDRGERDREMALRPKLPAQLCAYLTLLLRWNERLNLTAIRRPEEIVARHFGESLFAARYLPGEGGLLDLGSGAGFPGLPIQLWHPNLSVTLAESQRKKANFLREAVRMLGVGTTVWASRAELLGEGRFPVVCLRAVDDMRAAVRTALRLSAGVVWVLGTREVLEGVDAEVVLDEPLPERSSSRLICIRKVFHVEHR